ncbi:hypothetical protein PN478_18365 [Dolichospermum circinale CS-534/05]|uniref:hypothetical protein n=1 Tax=Dolichospermum circinale TaxID=109265 RepID=UPI00232B5FE5|nr:hypothetical protein [Dolichospermum circinale]MDB9492470.1 hypothetical protein [Dolichospermum circinale CS-534/05]
MANIQIADLHSENFVELTAEEQSLIQGGLWWVAAAVLIRAVTPIVVRAITVGGAAYIANKAYSK